MISTFHTVVPVWRAVFIAAMPLVLFLAGCQQPVTQRPLRVAISLDIPPYVIDRATSGIEVDLVREALPGKPIQFIQMPYHALQAAVPEGRADVAVAVLKFSDDGVFYSKEFIAFHNAAITRKSAGLEIDRVADLAGHKVLAWQGADLELGPDFKKLYAPNGPQRENYTAFADQADQVRAFWEAEADVIVIDRSIFDYFTAQAGHNTGDVVYHTIFSEATEFGAGFKDAGLRDTFNQRIVELCESGRFLQVLKKYHVEWPRTICDP